MAGRIYLLVDPRQWAALTEDLPEPLKTELRDALRPKYKKAMSAISRD